MPSASPRATATIRTSSISDPEVEEDDPFFAATPLYSLAGLLVTAGRRFGVRGRLRLGSLGFRQRLLVHGLAGDLRIGRRSRLGRGVVEQAALDDLLGAGVAALAHPGTLANATAQVVELGAPHVAAGRDLDLLDLRRVQRERALDADAEGLLADGEGLADALALALDDHALEDLRTATRALDDLEVDLDAIPGLEAGHAAQLRALERVDDGAHGEVRPRARGGRSW